MIFSYDSKKSQLSIFFIIGIILLISTLLIIIIVRKGDVVPVTPIDDITLDSNTIITHVESCIMTTRSVIKQITKNAGELDITHPLLYHGKTYNYWCRYSENRGCENRVFSKVKLENELNLRLKPIIDNCIDFSNYEAAGYSISKGILNINTAIGPNDLMVYVDLPLNFKKGEFEYEHSQFSHRFTISVGRMFEIANMILNEEIINGHFDKDEWMKQSGAEFIINKNRPYPDITYHLSRIDTVTNEWLELNFAIQGKDTVSNPSKIYNENPSGWCKEGDLCFFNPVNSLCDGLISTSKPNDCKDFSQDFFPNCIDDCKDCGIHQHGDEWCEYDSPPGAGMDFPGSRHYKMSCIDGQILTEPCRDYRDELCTESENKAICRPNRWKTCTQQQNKNSCEDLSQRDCMWADTVMNDFSKPERYGGNERNYCVPQVPPGLFKGSFANSEVCQLANEWMDCYGLTCPFVWSETSMIQCSRLGDCGQGYNIGGKISNSSFFTTDLLENSDGPNIDLLLGPEFIGRNYYSLNLPPYNYVSENYGSDIFNCDDCTYDDFLVRIEEYFDYINSLDIDDLILEYMLNGEIELTTRHFTFCLPFMAMEKGNCGSCYDPYKPCTQYKCENLGNDCVYYVDGEGYGRCRSEQSTSDSPVILVDTLNIDGYNSNIALYAANIHGKSLATDIPPFSPFTIRFNTTKPSKCSTYPLPLMDSNLPIPFFNSLFSDSNKGYNTSHEIVVYALPPEYFNLMLEGITEYHEVLNMLTITGFDDTIDEIMNELIDNLDDLSDIPGVSSSDIDSFIDELEDMKNYYSSDIRPMIQQIISEFNNFFTDYLYSMTIGEVYQFIRCSDINGNINEDDVFIKYKVGIDNNPPSVLSGPVIIDDVADNSYINMEVIMNEPSECRADVTMIDNPFQDMNYEMDCRMNFINVENGYKCNVTIPKSDAHCYDDGRGIIRFRCRDKIYLTDISQSNINTVSFTSYFNQNC
jgi:hypothetical protein